MASMTLEAGMDTENLNFERGLIGGPEGFVAKSIHIEASRGVGLNR